MSNRSLGYRGEEYAAHYLQSKGYRVIKNNLTVRGGEIDLVVMKGATLVFVEVKTRTSTHFGYGDESVNGLKKRRIYRAIEQYIESNALPQDQDFRIDIVEIELDPETHALRHIAHFEDIEV